MFYRTMHGLHSSLSGACAPINKYAGKYIIPGGIDTHTHLEMPFMGTTTIDDYHHGTRAAVAGGTTCLMDFIIPGKDQSLVEAHNDWESKAVPKINCDIAFHMAITYYSESMLKDMETVVNDLGVNSFKFFLAYNNVLRVYDDELIKSFRRYSIHGYTKKKERKTYFFTALGIQV